jgi:hypothetical protein
MIAEEMAMSSASTAARSNIEIIEPPPLVLPWAAIGKAGGKVLSFVLFLVLWLALLDFSKQVAGPNLDQSYAQAFGYFLKHDFQAGKDYIFTYGPLGYFLHTAYDPDLFWYKFAWEIAIKFVLALMFCRLFGSYSAYSARLLLGAIVLVFALRLLRMHDSLYLFLILSAGSMALASPKPSLVTLVSTALLLVILSLAKFTYFLLAASAMALLTAQLLTRKPRLWAVVPAGVYAGGFLVLWGVLRQSLANLPMYLSTSLQVASGYVEAMSLQGDRTEIYLAIAIVIMLIAALLGHPTRERLSVRHLAMLTLLGLGLFLQWKHGFVRHDTHALSFFDFALLVALTLPALFSVAYDWNRPFRVVLVSYCVILSVVGIFTSAREGYDIDQFILHAREHVRNNAASLVHPARLRAHLERDKEILEEQYALPRMRACIKDASVDLISYEQGILLLNHLNWHPRPVLQSYSAYTPRLLAANARFFRESSAPEFVIFRIEPVDGHLPSMEDSQAMFEIFKHYRPVLAERSYLLFQRSNDAVAALTPGNLLRQQRVHFNEEVFIEDLKAPAQKLSIHLRYTLKGKVRKLLYKPPSVSLAVHTADHACFIHRLVPGMAEDGFLINPLLQDNTDVVNLYGATDGKRVVSFVVMADECTMQSFENSIPMSVEAVPQLVSQKLSTMDINRLLYPMLESVPAAVRSAAVAQTRTCGTEDVLLVHPDGEMIFPVCAGAHQVHGRFGILPEAYEQGQTDGVEFVAEFVPSRGSPIRLFDRHLDPIHDDKDKGMQDLTVEAVLPSAGVVRLRTTNRPGNNTAWDWSYWTAVHIK